MSKAQTGGGIPAPSSEEHKLINTLLEVITDPSYSVGVTYGKPRTGHAEGAVKNHIQDLTHTLVRLARFVPTDVQKLKLMILIHVHDTCKYWATRDTPIMHNESHSTLARIWLAKFTNDEDLLQMVQLHDENWALWKNYEAKGKVKESRLLKCVESIKDIDTYLFFTILDGYTPSKEHGRIRWFIDLVAEKKPVAPFVYDALKELGL